MGAVLLYAVRKLSRKYDILNGQHVFRRAGLFFCFAMENNMKQYKCGCCGNSKYEIYQAESAIITKCTVCLTKSMIMVKAELKVDWYIDENNKSSDGCMCIG